MAVLIIAIVILLVYLLQIGRTQSFAGAVLMLTCIAYILNKLMNIEEKLDILLQQFDSSQDREA